jgi:hypothetical protein
MLSMNAILALVDWVVCVDFVYRTFRIELKRDAADADK